MRRGGTSLPGVGMIDDSRVPWRVEICKGPEWAPARFTTPDHPQVDKSGIRFRLVAEDRSFHNHVTASILKRARRLFADLYQVGVGRVEAQQMEELTFTIFVKGCSYY